MWVPFKADKIGKFQSGQSIIELSIISSTSKNIKQENTHEDSWYSFSETIVITLKAILSLSDRYKIFTSDWLWTKVRQNSVVSKLDITMTTINKKLWNRLNRKVVFSKPPREVKNSVCLNWRKTKVYFKLYIFNSRDKMFNKKVLDTLVLTKGSFKRLRNIIFRCWEILVYFLSSNPEN